MKIAVVIPTYKRIEKLERCLESLRKQTYQNFDIIVHCDANDKETYDWIKNNKRSVFPVLSKERVYVIGAWNSAAKEIVNKHCFVGFKVYSSLAWIVDDVELYPNCLEKTIANMEYFFPDLDGVIGIQQECPGHSNYTYKPYGQVLIGTKFIERYKEVDYKVCNPDYFHFHQDEELYEYAKFLNKFELGSGKLKHYHPAFIKEEMDGTHPIVRGELARIDKVTYQKRKEKKLIWGKTFELVNENRK